MAAHPMRSLKSSVGSKNFSSSFHAGPSSFQPIYDAKISAECLVLHPETQSAGLHSSWISRLLHTATDASIHSPATTSYGGLFPRKLTIFTDESRTCSSSSQNSNFSIIRPYLGFCPIKPPLPPLPPPKISHGDGDVRLVSSFGPFKVRETGKGAGKGNGKGVFVRGEEGEGERIRFLEMKMENEAIGGQISPFAVPFKSRLTRGSARVSENGVAGVDSLSSSRLQSCFGPWKVRSRLKSPAFGSLLASGSSGLDAARRRGSAYRDVSDGGSVTRSFKYAASLQDIHNMLDTVMPQQPGIQIGKREAEEQFSCWNMGRFKRANFVSSISSSFDSSRSFDMKRKQVAENINASKYPSKYRRI
ncbi:uncharacterized protein LOC110019618 [Phalaenopsis equestris]|uniref:uncharacterized protein LOC110019618 n=1 Tax=Phalaenopsis equestris TaxID=78828 RepID=UPI0009E654F9|nr:uncharacterized protein LOC110019618 [Phalaenopsis equestris]